MRLLGGRRAQSGWMEHCAVLSLVAAAAAAVQLSPMAYEENQYLVIRTAIVSMPLAVSACCMAVSWAYGRSKVFGRSFLVLGMAYAVVFAGEALYYFHLDPSGTQDTWAVVADAFFLASYPLLITHVAINVSYFVGRVGRWRALPAAVAGPVVAGYVLSVGADTAGMWMGAAAVAGSSALLESAVLAFAVFRHTAMSTPWTLLLAGIALGTVGDILYNHVYALDSYGFGDASTGLWLASYMVVAYALYAHYRSV